MTAPRGFQTRDTDNGPDIQLNIPQPEAPKIEINTTPAAPAPAPQ